MAPGPIDTFEHSISIDLPALSPGAPGFVEALAWMTERAGGPSFDLDELLCVTSVALKNYVYDPDINPAYDPPRHFALTAELFTNYGIFESFGHFTGWQIQEFNGLAPDDFFHVVRFEVSEDRALLSIGIDGPHEPVLIVGASQLGRDAAGRPGFTRPGQRAIELVRAGAADERVLADFTARDHAQHPDDEVFKNWVVVARHGERPGWARSIGRMRIDALRWGARHATATKEFFHETRDNYAPGLRGFAAFVRLVDQLTARTIAPHPEDTARYLATHLGGLARGRRALARRLPVWADELGQYPDLSIEDAGAVQSALREAASHYALVADALEGVLGVDLTDPFDAGALARIKVAVERAEAAEREALNHVRAGVRHIPQVY